MADCLSVALDGCDFGPNLIFARSYIGITSRTYLPIRDMTNEEFFFAVRHIFSFDFDLIAVIYLIVMSFILRRHATFYSSRIIRGGDATSYQLSRWQPLPCSMGVSCRMQVGYAEIEILSLYLALVPAISAATGRCCQQGRRWTTATVSQVMTHRW